LADLPQRGDVRALSVSSDGTLLAAGGSGGAALWHLADDGTASLLASFAATYAVKALAFSPDGTTLAVGATTPALTLWSVADPAAPTAIPLGPASMQAQVNGLVYTDDGSSLAAADSGSTVRFFRTSDWQQTASLPHTGPATGVTFTGDGRSVVTSSTDGIARIWPNPGPAVEGVGGQVFNLVFSSSGRLVVGVTGDDDLIALYDVTDRSRPSDTGMRLRAADVEPGAEFNAGAAISADGAMAAASVRGGPIGIWDLTGPAPVYVATLPEPTDTVSALFFSPDSRLLIAGGRSATVELWDMTDRDAPRHLSSTALPDDVYFVAFAPDSRHFAVADIRGNISLWDAGDAQRPVETATMSGDVGTSAYAVGYSADGRFLAAGGLNKSVVVWDVGDPARPVQPFPPLTGPRGEIYWVAFSPDTAQLAAVSNTDGTIWIWDLTAAVPTVTAVLSARSGALFTTAYSPDGGFLAGGGSASLVRLWADSPSAVASEICAGQGDGITADEWSLYLPEEPYEPPC
jgi:WD40 repeat protein